MGFVTRMLEFAEFSILFVLVLLLLASVQRDLWSQLYQSLQRVAVSHSLCYAQHHADINRGVRGAHGEGGGAGGTLAPIPRLTEWLH